MKKTFKKAISAAVAIVMTTAIAVPIGAEDSGCRHALTYKARTSLAAHYWDNHECKMYNTDGKLISEPCTISVRIHNCSYVCTSCQQIVASAGIEEERYHLNPHCNGR